jgi:hypothetical protein
MRVGAAREILPIKRDRIRSPLTYRRRALLSTSLADREVIRGVVDQ